MGLSFTLETVEGGMPKFDSKANVYFMPKKSANLLSLDYTKEIAAKLGYQFDLYLREFQFGGLKCR